MVLFVTTDSHIRSISMPSKEYGLIQSGILQVHSDTSEYDDGFVYWSENGKEKTDIFKSMVDGSAHQYVVSMGVETVEDLAMDWIGRHIYFTDSSRKHIVACEVHGKLSTVVISGHTCLLSPSMRGFQCARPIGLVLNYDNRNCDSSSVLQPSIIIASIRTFLKLPTGKLAKIRSFTCRRDHWTTSVHGLSIHRAIPLSTAI